MRDLVHELTWVRDGDAARTSPRDVDAGRPRGGIRRWVAAAAIAGVIATAAASGFWYYASRATAFAERDTIVVADFVNDTGDTVFDGTLKQAVSVKLEESPFVSVFPEARVRETVRMMEQPVDTRVTGAIAREVCQRHGVKALVAGSIASLGNQFVVALEAMNCATGEVIGTRAVRRERQGGRAARGREATVTLRERLGESLASIQTRNTPIEQATTSSLEAFKAFTIGNDLRFRVRRGCDALLPPRRGAGSRFRDGLRAARGWLPSASSGRWPASTSRKPTTGETASPSTNGST